MKNKILLALLSSSILLTASDSIPMPPMIPSLDTKAHTVSKKNNSTKPQLPASCELIPPMVIFLPPPMQMELTKCKNQLNKPKKEFVEKQLSKLFKKKITVSKVEVVEKFNQLYKVTYNGGTILVNKTVDGFINQ
jgi:exonuclease V gamma subunit